MEFFNVSGTPSISYFGPTPNYSTTSGGDQEQQIQLSFVAAGSQVEISWGGHITSRLDWGCADGPLSAGGISGSPYHMRLKDMTVNGVHVNLGNQDRSLSAAAVLVPPSITLSKTPSTSNICTSSNTGVTYTYVVSNTGAIAVSGSVVDDNGTPGNTADDVTIGTYNNLAPGASQSFTHVFTLNGTVTNIATATASASATATVTGHACTISITKTPSVSNICNSANTSVTYTYVVKNTGDFFNASGSVSDDVLGSIGTFGPLAPGASVTLTKVASVNGTQTNTGTASATFDDPASATASASATATVTGQVCSVSITKTPSISNVCIGANTSVTYTYVVTNNSDFFSFSGSVSDDKIGSIGSVGPLAPGASATLTASAIINSSVTNIGSVSGTFNDATGASASASASATVNAGNCAKITPTNTTCADFASGSAATLDTLLYSVKSDTINAVAPGVFFYWIGIPGSSGSNTYTLQQAITTGNFDSHFFSIASGSNVFDSSCNAVGGESITQNGANISIVFNAAGSGFFYIGIKFDATSVKGFATPNPTTVHYNFSTLDASNNLVAGSLQGLDLKKK